MIPTVVTRRLASAPAGTTGGATIRESRLVFQEGIRKTSANGSRCTLFRWEGWGSVVVKDVHQPRVARKNTPVLDPRMGTGTIFFPLLCGERRRQQHQCAMECLPQPRCCCGGHCCTVHRVMDSLGLSALFPKKKKMTHYVFV